MNLCSIGDENDARASKLFVPHIDGLHSQSFGLAWQAMNGFRCQHLGFSEGAEIGFMDPEVGVNVAFGSKLRIEDENA